MCKDFFLFNNNSYIRYIICCGKCIDCLFVFVHFVFLSLKYSLFVSFYTGRILPYMVMKNSCMSHQCMLCPFLEWLFLFARKETNFRTATHDTKCGQKQKRMHSITLLLLNNTCESNIISCQKNKSSEYTTQYSRLNKHGRIWNVHGCLEPRIRQSWILLLYFDLLVLR